MADEPRAVLLAREEANSRFDDIEPSWMQLKHVREVVAHLDAIVAERDALRARVAELEGRTVAPCPTRAFPDASLELRTEDSTDG